MKSNIIKFQNTKFQITKFLAVLMAAALCFGIIPEGADAASKNCGQIYSAVKKASGKSFPLKDKNLIKVKRKNLFGEYSHVMGVSAKNFSEYKAARIANSKYEYACFVCKAVNKSKVPGIKSSLKAYVKDEKTSNANYFSEKGKDLIDNARVESEGLYVALFILDTDNNKKAADAFVKAVK